MLQCRSKALTRASLDCEKSAFAHPQLTPPQGNVPWRQQDIQLAVRANANEHLGVAAHGRLEDGERAVGHLPVFLVERVSWMSFWDGDG